MTLLKNRKKRTWFLRAVTAVAVLLCLVGNLFLFYLVRENNFFGDMTTEGIYTLSPKMTEELKNVEGDVTITFCADPDILLGDSLLRPVYITAKKLSSQLENIHVETLSLSRDPHAADAYKTTTASELTKDDVIVSYEKKVRIAASQIFYSLDEEGEYYAYKGEYQLATMILSVTGVPVPCAYFTVGHGETVYDPDNNENPGNASLTSFYNLLQDLGMRVATIDLDRAEAIPDDCVLLIMNGPTTDYGDGDYTGYYSRPAVEKIDRYLEARGSMLFFRDPDTPMSSLPAIGDYLSSWGIAVNDDVIRYRDASVIGSEREKLSAVYTDKTTSPVSNALYSAVSDLTAAPRTVVPRTSSLSSTWRDVTEKNLTDRVSRKISPFLLAPDKVRAYDMTSGDILSEDEGYTLAMLGVTAYFAEDGTYTYSYLGAFGTSEILDETYLGSSAYGNRDILAAALRVLTMTDVYASSDLGSATDLNSANYGGKRYESDDAVENVTYVFRRGDDKIVTETDIGTKTGYKCVRTMYPLTTGGKAGWTIFVFVLPALIVPAAAAYIVLRRKHL